MSMVRKTGNYRGFEYLIKSSEDSEGNDIFIWSIYDGNTLMGQSATDGELKKAAKDMKDFIDQMLRAR